MRSTPHTTIRAGDQPGAGGACHEYFISRTPTTDAEEMQPAGDLGVVRFQNGPIHEARVNGCMNEDLIAIVIHRLRGFQSGPHACRENALALTKLEEALHWLNHRSERIKRGVEGTSVA